MSLRVLVGSTSFGRDDPEAPQMLKAAGCEVIPNPYGRPLTEDELVELLGDVDGLIAGNDWVGRRALERGVPRLRVVSRTGVGVDRVDLAAATRLGVVVTTTPGANSEAVAELALGLMVAVARHFPEADRTVRAGKWAPFVGRELGGKRLGLIGMGRIGKGVARRAVAGFSMEVWAYDVAWDEAFARQWGIRRVETPEPIFEACDVISLHAPELPQTRHLVNRERLRRMKPTAYLINTARAGLIDVPALVEALQQGWIAGAALDVFDPEPLPAGHPLAALPNVVLTPHLGAHTVEAVRLMGRMAAANLLAVLVEGRRPEGVVNPEVYAAGAGAGRSPG